MWKLFRCILIIAEIKETTSTATVMSLPLTVEGYVVYTIFSEVRLITRTFVSNISCIDGVELNDVNCPRDSVRMRANLFKMSANSYIALCGEISRSRFAWHIMGYSC